MDTQVPQKKNIQIFNPSRDLSLRFFFLLATNAIRNTIQILTWISLSFACQSHASVFEEENEALLPPAGPQKIICVRGEKLRVRGDDLREVVLTLVRFTPVNVIQDWNAEKKTLTEGRGLNKAERHFVLIETPSSEHSQSKRGWVEERYVQTPSDCAPYQSYLRAQKQIESDSNNHDEPEQNPANQNSPLENPNCCDFPLNQDPSNDWTEGMAKFGAGRARGRLHAASDLYLFKNAPVLAIADGHVLREKYRFYQGTWALEIRHTGGFVVRYGEIRGQRTKNIHEGAKVNKAAQVGLMGKVNSGCCEPMLHFELYSGERRGPLNSNSNAFKRRKDLLNPERKLDQWLK